MKVLRSVQPLWLAASAFVVLVLFAPHFGVAQGAANSDANAAVTVTDNGNSWTLDNGIVKATIGKNGGFLSSIIYRGFDTGSRGIWEHTPQGAPQVTNTIMIDPATNGSVSSAPATAGQ